MVFGLFNRKSTQDDSQTSASPESKLTGLTEQTARLPTPTPSTTSATHYSPLRFPTTLRSVLGGSTTDLSSLKESDVATDSLILIPDAGTNDGEFTAPPPPETPTPPPSASSECKALYDLMLTIPAKTLHAYTLEHLRPRTPTVPLPTSTSPALEIEPGSTSRPPSPDTAKKLTTFFSTLAPPPLLHCVRCHGDFYDIENEEKDKACRVAHDDESTLVERVSGGGHETLWGCCGQTVPGDGSEGPPDGWCYEGRHTTDTKRARFRADSTIHGDKLTSCLKLNCHGIRDQLPRRISRPTPSHNARSPTRKSNASPTRSHLSVVLSSRTRKRPRKSLKEASGSEGEGESESVRGRATKAKGKGKEKAGEEEKDEGEGAENEDTSMAVDEPNPPPKPKAKPKPKPTHRTRPPHSSSTAASASGPASNVASTITTITTPAPTPAKTKPKLRSSATKPKSSARTLLSQSHTHLASDSESSTRERPRTRSLVREESRVRDASRTRATPIRELARIRTPGKALTRESSRRKATKQAQASASDDEPEAEETPEEQESEQEGRGRGRKKRRVAA